MMSSCAPWSGETREQQARCGGSMCCGPVRSSPVLSKQRRRKERKHHDRHGHDSPTVSGYVSTSANVLREHPGTATLRLGMLTPSSNTVLEPITYRMLAGVPDVTAHFAR